MRERDPYEDRRSDAYYCREREFDRDAPYAPRGVQRGMERERERERERDYYDRDSRHARGYSDYQDAVPSYRRPQSPYGSRRSPPYRSGPVSPQHQPCRYPQSPPYERRESIPPRHSSHLTEEAPTRDVVIPTGPRGAPTGPRSSFGRPPTGPSSGYDNRGVGPPPPAAPRGPSFDGPPRSISRRVDEEGTPLSASAAPSFTTDKYSGWDNGETQKDVEPTVEPRVGTTSALDVPITAISLSRQASSDLPPRESVKKRLGNLHQMDFTGSGCAEQEAQAFNIITARLRSIHSQYSRSEFVALRQSLQELANSDVELAGARTRTTVAEQALNQAKEEAESWSLESARIEINEKNSGVLGWLTTSSY